MSGAAELIGAAVARLRSQYDEVIVDAGQVGFASPPAIAALLRMADSVVVVAGSDLVAAWNAQCCLRYLRDELGLPAERLALIVNRREGRGAYGAGEVEDALSAPVLAVIPEDRRAARRALAEQLPLTAVRGKAARTLRKLASSLTPASAEGTVAGKQRRWPLRLRQAAVGRR
jgi:Flp pilus assembly CpaE family ATPase